MNKSPDDVQLAIYDYAVERANGTLSLVAKIVVKAKVLSETSKDYL